METSTKDDRVLIQYAIFATYSNNYMAEFNIAAENEATVKQVFCNLKYPTSVCGDIFCNDQLVKFYIKELLGE